MDIQRIPHPISSPGPARRYWLTSKAARLVADLAVLACMAWLIGLAPAAGLRDALAVLAATYLSLWLAGRAGWLAWTEVPGAWRSYRTAAERDAAAPPRAPDLIADALRATVITVGGVLLATLPSGTSPFELGGPGEAGPVVIGVMGGAVLAGAVADLVRTFAARHADRGDMARLGIAFAPAIAWLLVGDPVAVRLGITLGVIVVGARILYRRHVASPFMVTHRH